MSTKMAGSEGILVVLLAISAAGYMGWKPANVGPLAGKCVGGPVTYSLLECGHSILQDTGERNATH